MHQIEALLLQTEGKTLEFKRDLSSPAPIMKTLVAFANSAGGRLIIGINDQREIMGISDPLAAEERLCNLIADWISPRLVPSVELFSHQGQTLLIVNVYLSNSRPHYIRAEGPEQGVYVRLGSTNRQADRELVTELKRSVSGQAFDEMPMPELKPEDLDLHYLQQQLELSAKGEEAALRTLRLLVQYQGHWVPSKGAVVLFGRERQAYFPDAWIQCGRFLGQDKTHIFDHQDIHEPLPQALETVLLFLKKHALRGADLSALHRKDNWSIPLGILREAISNALIHSDYSQRGAPIRIAFFDDRIEVENPGLLPPGMTFEDMKLGLSKIRNPVITRVFRELGLVEQWGSGVRRMFSEAQSQGLPEPQYLELGLRTRLSIFLKAPVSPSLAPHQSGAQSGAQSNELILNALVNGPLSSAQLQTTLSLPGKTGAFKRTLKELLTAGLIMYTIPEKPNSRLQKYQLTDHGRATFASPLRKPNPHEGKHP